jgi:hypothetical protein
MVRSCIRDANQHRRELPMSIEHAVHPAAEMSGLSFDKTIGSIRAVSRLDRVENQGTVTMRKTA